MRTLLRYPLALAVAGLALTGCDTGTTSPGTTTIAPILASASSSETSWVILGKGNRLPDNLAALVSQAGGTLTATMPQIGIALASSSSGTFRTQAAALPGVHSVARDLAVQWVDPSERVLEAGDLVDAAEDLEPASHGNNETFYNAQWAPKAVGAPAAWDLGYLGTGIRVAVLDGGLNNTHIDLNGSVDVARSASFVPGFAFNQDVAGFSHATHVAGIIAAQDDGIGAIGIAPGATIVGVKVLHNGSGSFGAVIQGIVYAATSLSHGGAGANIINMSLGAGFERQHVDAAKLAEALSRATTYAYQQGVTVIASAGNSAVDLDHTNNLIFVPAQSANVIAVSATGPLGFAVGYPAGDTRFSRPASYTNYGQSAITFGAPGGDFALPGNALCSVPRIPTGSVTTACWVFDMVISPGSIPGNTSYYWAAGTSMAAPAVAGVAALIMGKYGPLHPSMVREALFRSADDLGKPGQDDYYGGGFVNALRAVQ